MGKKQSTGGNLQGPSCCEGDVIIPLFVPALNNLSKRLLFVCLTYTDLWSVAAVRTAQNKLSLGNVLTESTGLETPQVQEF